MFPALASRNDKHVISASSAFAGLEVAPADEGQFGSMRSGPPSCWASLLAPEISSRRSGIDVAGDFRVSTMFAYQFCLIGAVGIGRESVVTHGYRRCACSSLSSKGRPVSAKKGSARAQRQVAMID